MLNAVTGCLACVTVEGKQLSLPAIHLFIIYVRSYDNATRPYIEFIILCIDEIWTRPVTSKLSKAITMKGSDQCLVIGRCGRSLEKRLHCSVCVTGREAYFMFEMKIGIK